jgi:hypothetical protein
MKKVLLALTAVTIAAAAPVQAQITHRIQTSVQMSVDAAASAATRIGSSYSVSGSNLTTSDGTTAGNIGRLGTLTSGAGVGFTGTTASVKDAGESFNFAETYIEGDARHAGSSVSSGVVGTLPVYGVTTTTAGGVRGDLAGTIGTDGAMALTSGGAGTSITGQHVSEITIR